MSSSPCSAAGSPTPATPGRASANENAIGTGLPAGLAISPATGKITGTPAATGTSSITVTAKDSTGATGSASFSWTVTSGVSGCAARQLLGNPDFGTGKIAPPWTASAGVLTHASAGVPAYSSSWVAWLDGYGGAHVDTLEQTVAIPSGCKSATFSFWLDISSNDPAGGAYDTLAIQVLSGRRILGTLARYSNLNASSGYVRHALALTSYTGQTITLRLTGTETLNGHTTSFFEDGNALNVS